MTGAEAYMEEARRRYEFTAEDRAEFEYWLQRIPTGEAEEALFRCLGLKLKHDLRDIRMTTAWSEVFLRDADAKLAGVAEVERKIDSLLELAEYAAKERTDLTAAQIELATAQAQLAKAQAETATETRAIRVDMRWRAYAGFVVIMALMVLIFALAWFDPQIVTAAGR